MGARLRNRRFAGIGLIAPSLIIAMFGGTVASAVEFYPGSDFGVSIGREGQTASDGLSDPLARSKRVPLLRQWASGEPPLPSWTTEVDHGIGPGSELLIWWPDSDGVAGTCTANFVFTDSRHRLYLGTAGHCLFSPNAVGMSTHGPDADYAHLVFAFKSP